MAHSSVHSGLIPLLWSQDEAAHHGGKAWWREAALLLVPKKQREGGEGAPGKMHSSRAHLSDLPQPHPLAYSYHLVGPFKPGWTDWVTALTIERV